MYIMSERVGIDGDGDGMEAASIEILMCREAECRQTCQSNMPAYEAAPRIRGGSWRLLRS